MASTIDSVKTLFKKLSSQLSENKGYNPDLLKQIDDDLELLKGEMDDECRDNPEIWENEACGLFEALCECKKLIITALEKIDSLQADNSKIRKEIEKIEARIEQLEGLKQNEFILKLGQVAYEVEEKLISTVLDGIVGSEEHVSTIKGLTKAIKNKEGHSDVFRNESGRIEAKRRWDSLKSEIGWDDRLSRYFYKLKENRVPIAHPKLDIDDIRDTLAHDTVELPAAIADKPLLLKLIDIFKQY